MKLVNYGNWYYDHGSTWMPVLVDETGHRSDWGKVGLSREIVTIRPATCDEHARMAREFDVLVDQLAGEGFVCENDANGTFIGNFDAKTPPSGLAEAVARLKARARTEAIR